MSVPNDRTRLAELVDLFEHEPCGHVLTDMDGLILRANAMFLEMTGYARAELVGRRRLQELATAGTIYYETHLRPLLHMQGYLREIALEIRRADGSSFPILINSVVRQDAGGQPAAIQTIVFDATERRAYERELLVTTRRFERLQRVAAVFVSALEDEGVAHEALAELVDGVKADHGLLALLDPSGEWVNVVGARPQGLSFADGWQGLRVADVGPLARAILDAEPQFIEGVTALSEVPRMTGPETSSTRLAILPLEVDGRTLGVLCLASASLTEFQRDERVFLVSFTQLVAQALERGRLYRAEQLVAQRAGFLSALGRALDEKVELRERAQHLVDMLVPEYADFATVELPGASRRPIGARHRDDELLEPLLELRERTNIPEDRPHSIARARSTGEPQMLNDISDDMYSEYAGDDRQLTLLRCLAPRAYLGLPLRARGEIAGSLLLAMAGSGRRFSDDDLPFFTEIADRGALAIENARLLEHERGVAHRLQLSLLPQTLPVDERVRLSALYRPGTELLQIGGDWYDAFLLSESRLGIAVGDVVGHDIEAATAMGQVRTALRALALESGGPAEAVGRLSRFVRSVPEAFATTLAYAELDLESREMRYTCAGHPPPIVFGPRNGARPLWDGRSPPLGVQPDVPPPEGRARLDDDETLFLYTDGLIERRGLPLDTSLQRLIDRLRSCPELQPDAFVDQLVASFLEGVDQADDVCVLGVFPGTREAAAATRVVALGAAAAAAGA